MTYIDNNRIVNEYAILYDILSYNIIYNLTFFSRIKKFLFVRMDSFSD